MKKIASLKLVEIAANTCDFKKLGHISFCMEVVINGKKNPADALS
ncbi:hypothetical protein VOA_002336 [Vibrio sp. RC586]|nr:hypothetical protein VOA_002336 [Vibrio sp. RC586]